MQYYSVFLLLASHVAVDAVNYAAGWYADSVPLKNWLQASNVCSARGLRLATFQEYCGGVNPSAGPTGTLIGSPASSDRSSAWFASAGDNDWLIGDPQCKDHALCCGKPAWGTDDTANGHINQDFYCEADCTLPVGVESTVPACNYGGAGCSLNALNAGTTTCGGSGDVSPQAACEVSSNAAGVFQLPSGCAGSAAPTTAAPTTAAPTMAPTTAPTGAPYTRAEVDQIIEGLQASIVESNQIIAGLQTRIVELESGSNVKAACRVKDE